MAKGRNRSEGWREGSANFTSWKGGSGEKRTVDELLYDSNATVLLFAKSGLHTSTKGKQPSILNP